ncbi:MAG: hypothetical protein ACR2FO_04635 [Actinomycetota bacterium]
MIPVLFSTLVVLGIAFWVMAPFLRRGAGPGSLFNDQANDLLESKEAIYRSIIDLEFDQKMDKVAKSDYLVMRRQLEDEAMQILQQIDDSAPVDALEAEISAARERLRRH